MTLDMSNMLPLIILLRFSGHRQGVMSSLIGICLSVCVFYGNCLYSNAEPVESTSGDWKQLVEIRLMKLENELRLQSKENERIKAENDFLRSQFQESKDRENELLKIVWGLKSSIEKHLAKNHPKNHQMEIGLSGISHKDAEPVKRIGKISSFTNFWLKNSNLIKIT